MGSAAIIAVVALVCSIYWRYTADTRALDSGTATSALAQNDAGVFDPLQSDWDPALAAASSTGYTEIGAATLQQLIGTYTALQESGMYTPETGQAVAESIGENMKPQIRYTAVDSSALKIDRESSVGRLQAYREDLQECLEPLLKNNEAEFVVYGRYVETKDVKNLEQLHDFALNYRTAKKNCLETSVPADATTYHVAMVNALEKFAATLEAMATHAHDPFAAAALLVNYNDAEHDMFASFRSIATFFKAKLS